MKKSRLLGALCACVISIISIPSHASLIDRGGGLIYDDILNVTWLQYANYAMTSGYDADGLMTWSEAVTWASNLSYGGHTDWRLPIAGPVNGTTYNYNLSYIGNTDFGQNMGEQDTTYAGSTSNEMAHLNFTSLDNKAKCSPSSVLASDSVCIEQSGWGGAISIANTGPFINLQTKYWSGTEYAPDTDKAWNFTFIYGSQSGNEKTINWAALAVHDGDIGTVPLPAATWLFGSGLLGLIGMTRRKTIK